MRAGDIPFFRSVHGLRGVAAMMVVFYHYGLIFYTLRTNGIGSVPAILDWGDLKTFGAAGVPIFFVISGLVMGLQRFEPGVGAIADFMSKRIIRVVPLYWLATAVLVALMPKTPSLDSVLGSFFFVQQLRGDLPVLQPGWSLEYEMFFYGMFASLVVSGLLGTRKRGTIALIISFVGIFGAHWAFPSVMALAVYGSPVILEFLLGLLIARIYCTSVSTCLWPANLVAAISLFAVSCLPDLSSILTQALRAGGAFLIVLALVGAERRGCLLLAGPLAKRLGDASYAIYLSHMLLIYSIFVWPLWHWKWQQYLEPHLALLVLVTTAASVGLLVHTHCEAPMTRALRKWARPRTPVTRSEARGAAE